jgi:hypothetical protein
MSEEILDEQTITDEIEEQDNSDVEPIEEVDNSQTDESEDEDTAESKSEENVEKEKKEAEQNEFIKKSFSEEDTEKVQNFLKKMIGDIDISELSEREIKILKSNYHAERLANEKAQKLNELEKEKEQNSVKAEEQEIVKLDFETTQSYNYELSQKDALKIALLTEIENAYENGIPYTYLDGQTYNVDLKMFREMTQDIERRYLIDINAINNKYSQLKYSVESKKAEKSKKESERFFAEYETSIKDKLVANPELTEVFNFIKKEAVPNKEFIDTAFNIVEEAINKAAERIFIQRQEEAENEKATLKANGAVNNSSSSVSKTKSSNLTVDDILAMSDEEVAKL